MHPPTLQTERLLLRPFQSEDGLAFHALMSDPKVLQYTAALPLTKEQAQEIVDNLAGSFLPSFAIALKQGGSLIGTCRLRRSGDEAEAAYFLRPHYWGQGYTTEAVRALIDYGFETLHLRRIFAQCLAENIASKRVMEKAGMRQEEPLTLYAEDGNYYQGAFQDVTFLCYGIDRPLPEL